MSGPQIPQLSHVSPHHHVRGDMEFRGWKTDCPLCALETMETQLRQANYEIAHSGGQVFVSRGEWILSSGAEPDYQAVIQNAWEKIR